MTAIVETLSPAQTEENDVLESIYPDFFVSNKKNGKLILEIPVQLEIPRPCRIHPPRLQSGDSQASVDVSCFPPIHLHISIPSSYPECMPTIDSVYVEGDWYDARELSRALENLWVPGETVLYSWIEYIHNAAFLEDCMEVVDGVKTLLITHPSPSELATFFAEYETASKENTFNQNAYTCAICFDSFKGVNCVQLSCQHVFCRPCLGDFWTVCIKEGDLARVACPDTQCDVKETAEKDVARVVTEAEVQRWRWLKEKRMMEKDPTILECPRSTCRAFVPLSKDVDPGWEAFRECSRCFFTFCASCKAGWHGTITPCRNHVMDQEKVLEEYLAEPEGSPKRRFLEQRYGRLNVVRLVRHHMADRASEVFFKESTTVKNCPGCKIYVQKIMGCNHMTCTRCGVHFCFRCADKLSAVRPYAHYSQAGPCYRKVFDDMDYVVEDDHL